MIAIATVEEAAQPVVPPGAREIDTARHHAVLGREAAVDKAKALGLLERVRGRRDIAVIAPVKDGDDLAVFKQMGGSPGNAETHGVVEAQKFAFAVAVRQPVKKAAAPAKKLDAKRRLQLIVAIAAVVFIILGVINGSAKAVYTKAANICTECVGLG